MASPLLSLPAELRNCVYREVIVNRKPHEGNNPQLLVTCKQVHGEAADLLHTENEINISINCTMKQADNYLYGRRHSVDAEHTNMSIHTQQWMMVDAPNLHAKQYELVPMLRLTDTMTAWPSYLRNIERLRLKITVAGRHQDDCDSVNYASISTLLFGLTSFLEEGNRLKHLAVEVSLGDSDLREGNEKRAFPFHEGFTDIQCVFYPLRRFGCIEHITLEGLPATECDLFRRWMKAGPSYATKSTVAHAEKGQKGSEEPPATQEESSDNDHAMSERGQSESIDQVLHQPPVVVVVPAPAQHPEPACVHRPHLLQEFVRLDQEYNAYDALCKYLALPESPGDDDGEMCKLHNGHVWQVQGGQVYSELREQSMVYFCSRLGQQLDMFNDMLQTGGMATADQLMTDTYKVLYAAYKLAREERLARWTMDE